MPIPKPVYSSSPKALSLSTVSIPYWFKLPLPTIWQLPCFVNCPPLVHSYIGAGFTLLFKARIPEKAMHSQAPNYFVSLSHQCPPSTLCEPAAQDFSTFLNPAESFPWQHLCSMSSFCPQTSISRLPSSASYLYFFFRCQPKHHTPESLS